LDGYLHETVEGAADVLVVHGLLTTGAAVADAE
jgi:hypothetical protein